jgi:hypothetical protein
MVSFDVSKDWVILVPSESVTARKVGADLARIIGLLRGQAGLLPKPAVLADAYESNEMDPIILLNAGSDQDFRNGFSWRLGVDRLEIFGDSGKGLCNGVYSFLAALRVRWPRPGREDLPFLPLSKAGAYPLVNPNVYRPSETDPHKRRRLVITKEIPFKNREQALLWAVRNCIDALVLPFEDKAVSRNSFQKNRKQLLGMAKDYALIIEIGGWELSLLVPRRKFSFHREVFRMEMGRRVKDHHFCPTNPSTIAIIKQEAKRRFQENPDTTVFHLWPDRKNEFAWCSCPTCRAFSRGEQNRIAVNTAADVLAETAPESRLSYYGYTGDPGNIPARRNMFGLWRLPGDAGAEDDGLFLAE